MLALWAVILLTHLAIPVLLYQGVAILFAYQTRRLDPAPPSEGPPGRIEESSVVVAARNEAIVCDRRIGWSTASLNA